LNTRKLTECLYWRNKDPIKGLKKFILKEKILNIEEINSYHQRIQKMIDEAVDFARKSPVPLPEKGVEDVYAS